MDWIFCYVNLILANMFTLVFKGTATAFALAHGGKMFATTTFLLLTLPNLLTAISTTMERNNVRKVLIQHPHLLLLPTYTFYSFEKLQHNCNCGCAELDHKIRFSKRMSIMNIIIQSICFGVVFGLSVVWQFDSDWKRGGLTSLLPDFSPLTIVLLVYSLPPFILAIILSMIFLFMEKCCGCCCLSVACCNISDQIRVFDPDREEVKQEEAVEMEQVQVEMEEAVNMEQVEKEGK